MLNNLKFQLPGALLAMLCTFALLVSSDAHAGGIIIDGCVTDGRGTTSLGSDDTEGENADGSDTTKDPGGEENDAANSEADEFGDRMSGDDSEKGSAYDRAGSWTDALTAREIEVYLLAASIINGHMVSVEEPVPPTEPAASSSEQDETTTDDGTRSAGIIASLQPRNDLAAEGCAATPASGLLAVGALLCLLRRRR